MDIVISHTTALVAMRRPYFPRHLAQAAGCPTRLPCRMPSPAELAAARDSCPLLADMEGPLDVLVDRSCIRHRSSAARVHTRTNPLPSGSLVPLAPGVRCVAPLMAAVQVAPLLTRLELVLLLAELFGTYVPQADPSRAAAARRQPLATPAQMEALLASLGSTEGVRPVRTALAAAPVAAASIMEAKLHVRAAEHFSKGGWRLGELVLNDALELRRIAYEVPSFRVRKPDLTILSPHGNASERPFRGVALDYKGAWHGDPSQIRRDDERQNELLSHGIKGYVIWKEQYDDLDHMDGLMRTIRSDVGLPERLVSRERRERERRARRQLWAELERIDGVRWAGLP